MEGEKYEGFVAGIVYAASLVKEYCMDSEEILRQSNIKKEDLIKYADEHDLKALGLFKKQ